MPRLKHIPLTGAAERPFLLDLYYPATGNDLPVVVFVHGFKGFKDWGHWQALAERFVAAGYVFVKFNLSHNGTAPDAPLDFTDLEAFGQNNFSKELTDIEAVFRWLEGGAGGHLTPGRLDTGRLALIGHSRGGAISLIKAAEDARVRALVTWAAVSELSYAWQEPGFIEQWREEGVYHVVNSRTGQEMPLYYQLYEDFKAREDRLDTERAMRGLAKPCCIIHGSADPAVPARAAQTLHAWNPAAELQLIPGADHVFQGRHPWPEGEALPPESEALLAHTLAFLGTHL
jgi:dienelactone hydrolase